jgi:hypothetical protein
VYFEYLKFKLQEQIICPESIIGACGACRVAQCLGFAPGGEILPAALVHPAGGRAHWWLDRPAAQRIPENNQ